MAKVYPNGLADVNHFHAAGGLGYMIGELLDAGLLHPDTQTVAGTGLSHYTKEPKLTDGALTWADGAKETLNDKVLRPASDPFQKTGGWWNSGQPRARRDEGLRRRPRTPRDRGARGASSTTRKA
jgi:phosphogluconate dehydratase